MNPRTILLALAALLGGQFVHAASVPVIERTAPGGAPVATPVESAPGANTSTHRPATSAERAPRPVNPAAELLLMVDQLQEELRYLRGQVEEQQNMIRRMRDDQRDRYRDLDRRISLLTEQVAQRPAADPGGAASGLQVAPAASVAPVATAAPAVAGKSDTDAYKEAFGLVRQRAFPQALAAFEQFLIQYPTSTLVPNVLYWSGEVHRARPDADFAAAEKAYAALVARYPAHSKAADAYYKLGLTYEALGDNAKAKQMMETVVGRFPDQSSAKLAREYLARQ